MKTVPQIMTIIEKVTKTDLNNHKLVSLDEGESVTTLIFALQRGTMFRKYVFYHSTSKFDTDIIFDHEVYDMYKHLKARE